jgi:acylphosphatase
MAGQDRGTRRLTARFRGTVQGVGFRFTTVRLAQRFDVAGYVRNERDGSVTVVAEGRRDELDAFLNAVRTSSLGGYIRGEETAWGPAEGAFAEFDVRYTT